MKELYKRDLSKECDMKYKDCVDCVLDKPREEIEQEEKRYLGTGEETIQDYADGLYKALQFIDKYIAESEVEI